jgi:hypothetical protein
MQSLFGSRKLSRRADDKLSVTKAIEDLQENIRMLQLRIEQDRKKSVALDASAKLLRNSNRSKALLQFKKKKAADASAERYEAQLLAQEGRLDTLRDSELTRQTVASMRGANASMRSAAGGVSPDDVDDLHDDMEDAARDASTIAEIIAGSKHGAVNDDDDDLGAEFDAMCDDAAQDEIDATFFGVGTPAPVVPDLASRDKGKAEAAPPPQFASPPTEPPMSAKERELLRELQELEASMAGV